MPVETNHLILRPYQESDAPALFEIQGNREHMKFTHWVTTLDECRAWMQAYEASRQHLGFAPWVLVHRVSQKPIGWGGLNVDPAAPEWGPEVAYFIHPGFTGLGLATELVAASLRIGFSEIRLSSIAAFTRPENRASARVLTKCGFEFVRYESRLERDHYRVTPELWSIAQKGPRNTA